MESELAAITADIVVMIGADGSTDSAQIRHFEELDW